MEDDSDYEDINYLNQTISDDELSDVENCDGAMAMSPIKKMREENEDKENKIPTPIPKDKTAGKIKTIFLDINFSSFLADTHHEATYACLARASIVHAACTRHMAGTRPCKNACTCRTIRRHN
jgi:hypothetical protein